LFFRKQQFFLLLLNNIENQHFQYAPVAFLPDRPGFFMPRGEGVSALAEQKITRLVCVTENKKDVLPLAVPALQMKYTPL
jgi:hypothetical protein